MNETTRTVEEALTSPDGVQHRIGRVRFFAARKRVSAYLNKGHSLIWIYRRLQADLQMSYSQFSRYVAQFLTHPIPEHYPWGMNRKRTPKAQKTPSNEPRRDSSVGQPRFTVRRDTPRESLI